MADGHLDRCDGHPFDVWPALNAIAALRFWRSSAGYQVYFL